MFQLPLPPVREEIGMDLVPEQMFVRGCIPSMIQQGWFTPGDYPAISGAMRELSAFWRAHYPEDRQGTPSTPRSPTVERGRGGAPKGKGVPSGQIPAADMTHFHTWGDEPIGIGKKICKAVGRQWSDVTWREAVDNIQQDDSRGSDFTYLEWLATSLDNKSPGSREITGRAKAVVEAIRDPFG